MNNSRLFQSIFRINSDNPSIVRQGRLLQILCLLLITVSFSRFIFAFLGYAEFSAVVPPLFNIAQLLGAFLFLFTCLYFIRKGEVATAVHIFAVVLIFFFFVLQLTLFRGHIGLLYLMLIPVVAVAALDRIQASIIYAIMSVVATAVCTLILPAYNLQDFIFFCLGVAGVCTTIWGTVTDLQQTAAHAQNLATESDQKTSLLQRRTHQLQRSAQIGQQTGITINLDQLLQDTAQLIREEFGYYHVSIFLLDEKSQTLQLEKVAGQAALLRTETPFELPLGDGSIAGWAAANRTVHIAPRISQDPHYLADPLLPETRAEMALPLLARDKLLGVLDVQSQYANVFGEENIAILQIVANQLAVNIDNARLFTQTEAALQETRALYEYNALLATTLDVGEVYRRAARALALAMQARRCLILAWQPENNTAAVQVGFEYGIGPDQKSGFFWDTAVYPAAAHPHIQQALANLQPAIYQLNPDQSTPEQEILATYNSSTFLAVPMLRGTDTNGLIWLFRDGSQPGFQTDEIQLVQAMANQTAVALSNATLTSDAHMRVAQLSTINRMSVTLSHASSLRTIFDGARREIMALIPANGLSISLINKDGQHINWLYGYEFGYEVDLSSIPPIPLTKGFTGQVVRSQEMLYVEKDNFDLRQQFQPIVIGEDQSAWLGLPMVVSGEVIGVLSVETEETFNEREIDLLKTVVGPLASAIHNFIQLEELQEALQAQSMQRVQLQTAAEVAAAATSVLQLEQLVQQSVDLIKERFELYYVGLFLVDTDANEAVLVAGTGEAGQIQVQEGRRLTVGGKSLIGGATGDGQARIIQDVLVDEEWLPNPHLPQTRSELALPLRVHGRVIGALTVQSTQPNLFNPELVQVLQTLCGQLATAIENARLLARVEARAKRQHTLNQISNQLHQTANVEEIVHIGLHALSDHFKGMPVRIQLGKEALSHPAETDGS